MKINKSNNDVFESKKKTTEKSTHKAKMKKKKYQKSMLT